MKRLILYLGLASNFGLALSYYWTFVSTYFFGDNYKSNFVINAFGEAHIELVVFTFFIVLGMISLFYMLNKFGGEIRNDKTRNN